LAQVLGLEALPKDETDARQKRLRNADIENLIQRRQNARKQRNFAVSDLIREQLQAVGVTLIDESIQNSKFKIKDSHPQGGATAVDGFPGIKQVALAFLPTL